MPNQKWTLRDGKTFEMTGVMGIVNLTPDSFFDQGRFASPAHGLEHARQLWREGAHILDLGAESSRPSAVPIDANEEMRRLMPVLNPLLEEIKNAKKNTTDGQTTNITPYISVDTYHAQTAKAALEAGVHIINDISACSFDEALLEVVTHYKPGYVLMHSTNRPDIMQEHLIKGDLIDHLRLFFEFHLNRLVKAGLPEENIILDLGIGFGKSFEQNLELINNIHFFNQFGRPLLIAISMKSFFYHLLSLKKEDFAARAKATQTMTSILAMRGFNLHRVHHVADTLNTLRLVQSFRRKDQ